MISTEVLHRRRPSLPTCLRAARSCIQREGPSGFGFGIASRSCGSGKIFAGSKSLGTLRMRFTNAGGTTEIEVCSSLWTRIGRLRRALRNADQPQYARRVAALAYAHALTPKAVVPSQRQFALQIVGLSVGLLSPKTIMEN